MGTHLFRNVVPADRVLHSVTKLVRAHHPQLVGEAGIRTLRRPKHLFHGRHVAEAVAEGVHPHAKLHQLHANEAFCVA
jgi:hypothetical protein